MSFDSRANRSCALRAYLGLINAVTGHMMDDHTCNIQGDQRAQDYVVVPGQKWLDGICVQEGVVRQFVAMPCE